MPYPSQDNWQKFWDKKGDKDYINISKGWTWNEDVGLKCLAGKKGIRVIKFMNIENMNFETILSILNKALFILRLPQSYPWIILTSESISIVVESGDDIPDVRNISFLGRKDLAIGETILLWNADFILPSLDSKVRFLSIHPNEKPSLVSNSNLFKCLNIFRDFNDLEDPKKILDALKLR